MVYQCRIDTPWMAEFESFKIGFEGVSEENWGCGGGGEEFEDM